MNFGALPERLAAVRAEIARRQGAGRWTHPVTIVAVTKGFGLDAVQAALEVGLSELGENRVQEALPKIDDPVGRGASWHLIGHLQRNKAKLVPGRFVLVQSVDSLALAEELQRRAAARGVTQRVLLQVNVAGEAQKSGCALDEAPALARAVARLRDALQEDGLWLPALSMGMSADYATAVEEGTTMIRLGTALFGPRQP